MSNQKSKSDVGVPSGTALAESAGERARDRLSGLLPGDALEEVYERPAKPFVAGFIGISNLIPGKVEDGRVRLVTGALCPAPVPEDSAAGADVQLSVRPEKIQLDAEEGNGMVRLPGTVAERVYVGTATQVIVELGEDARIVALEQNTQRARADDRWELGDRVTVCWLPEHSLVLR